MAEHLLPVFAIKKGGGQSAQKSTSQLTRRHCVLFPRTHNTPIRRVPERSADMSPVRPTLPTLPRQAVNRGVPEEMRPCEAPKGPNRDLIVLPAGLRPKGPVTLTRVSYAIQSNRDDPTCQGLPTAHYCTAVSLVDH